MKGAHLEPRALIQDLEPYARRVSLPDLGLPIVSLLETAQANIKTHYATYETLAGKTKE